MTLELLHVIRDYNIHLQGHQLIKSIQNTESLIKSIQNTESDWQ